MSTQGSTLASLLDSELAPRVASRLPVCRRAWPLDYSGWSALLSTEPGVSRRSWAIVAGSNSRSTAGYRLERRPGARQLLAGTAIAWPLAADPLIEQLEASLAALPISVGTAAVERLVSYKPLRRVVARLACARGDTLYAKQVRPGKSGRVVNKHLCLRGHWPAGTGFELPALHHHGAETGLILWRALPGRPLHTLRSGSAVSSALSAIGRNLATLHRCPIVLPAGKSRRHELEAVESWLRTTGPLLDERAALGKSLKLLRAEARRLPGARTVACHGDLHDGQFLVRDSRVALLDLDTLSRAEPELDLGNLLAHFDARHLAPGGWRAADELDSEAILLETYASGQGPSLNLARLGWYRALTAVRMALVHAARAESRAHIDRLTALALQRVRAVGTSRRERAS